MRYNKHVTLPLAALILTVCPLLLSAADRTLSLEECIREALSNNPNIKAGTIRIDKAREEQQTALDIDKTALSLTQDPTSGGSPDNSWAVSQSFRFPTVYASRHRYLKAATQLERSSYEVSRNELIREVTGDYYSLRYARELLHILQKQDSICQRFVFLANAKFEHGETGRLEQMNAERMYNENRIALRDAETTCTGIQLRLQKWLNSDDLILPAEPALTLMPWMDPASEIDFNLTPAGSVFADRAEISKREWQLSKQDFFPDINFTVRSQLLIKGFNPYDIQRERFEKGNFMGFEVGLSFPLFWGSRRAKSRAAQKGMQIARLQQENAMLTMSRAYQSCRNDYAKALQTVEYYRKQGAPQAKEIERISQVSYEKGEINYVEYIQNLRSVVDIYMQYAKAIDDCNQTVIKLNYLQGNK